MFNRMRHEVNKETVATLFFVKVEVSSSEPRPD
jgi:hypothetical protein